MSIVATYRRKGRVARILQNAQGQQLHCGFYDLSDDDLYELFHQIHLPYTTLSLENNQITGRGLMAMKDFSCEKLITLNLNFNHIGSEGLKIISTFTLINIKNASFQRNMIDARGIRHLSKVRLPNIQCLSLSHNSLGDSFSILLCANWKSLKVLNLKNNNIELNWKTVRLLTANWPSITTLRISIHCSTQFCDDLAHSLLQIQMWLLSKFPVISTLQLQQ